MSWKSIEREKSIEAHNYHMRILEQKKIDLLQKIFNKLDEWKIKSSKEIRKDLLTLF